MNDQTRDILSLFRFGVARELVDAKVLTALSALDLLKREKHQIGLNAGESLCRWLRNATSSRSGSGSNGSPATGYGGKTVRDMRYEAPRMIDQSGAVWMYRPEKHKTAHHGKRNQYRSVEMERKPLEFLHEPESRRVLFLDEQAYALGQG